MWRSILFALDLEDASSAVPALFAAARLRDACGARLALGTVVPAQAVATALWASLTHGQRVERAREQLGRLAGKAEVLDSARLVETGDVGAGLYRLLEEAGADLIVLGASDREWGARRSGSDLLGVALDAPCPVLILGNAG